VPHVVDPLDTIVALATARGGAARGVVRLSGPRAWQLVEQVFQPKLPDATSDCRPAAVTGSLALPPMRNRVPATLFLGRAPRSYTGQDLVEVHTLGSPPILECVIATLVARGARAALPGEFTMRAFLSGKLDLTAAEAVLGLIDATSARQAEVALRQMAGGIARPIGQLRNRLLDLLAELEAGLDFAEEDIEFIDRAELRSSLAAARTTLGELSGQMTGRSLSRDHRRVVLVGPPNAGKSSLFNALVGSDAALVSRTAGTTRDYLVGELRLSDSAVELIDTAGVESPTSEIDRKSQAARDQAALDADLLLWCVDLSDASSATIEVAPLSDSLIRDSRVFVVGTKLDLAPAATSHHSPLITHSAAIAVSARTGAGLTELREAIAAWVRGGDQSESTVVATTAARCRQSIDGALAAIDAALAAAESAVSDDLIAAELRLALDELAHVVGAVYTDDILDRIFSRFCIGK